MKQLLFLFFPFILFGLEINVDYYQKNNRAGEILTLYNNFAFECVSKQKEVDCFFDNNPSTSVFKTKSRFFKFIPVFGKKFELKILIKKKYIVFSKPDNLYKNPFLKLNNEKKAKKWIIIAGDETLLSKKTPKGLDFYFKDSPKIYIGAVDDKGNPININHQSQDVIAYFKILKGFNANKDETDNIDEFIKNFPNSIFLPDVLYMKMVYLERNNDFEDLIEIGKKWIKKYAYDEHLPKVLLLMAQSYSKMGFLSDATYFFNRIITEYPNTNIADLAKIYLADQLYSVGDSKNAMKLYENVLYSTKNLDTASLAAARLASRYMNKGQFKKAYEYYLKIYDANKKFLLKDKQKAYELAKMLASHKMYSLAINIGEDILKKLKKFDDLYEPLLYNLAKWSDEAGKYKQSLSFINKYLKMFPYGDYSDQISTLRDKVLFNVPDKNVTKQLQYINDIIKNYKGSDIAKKALVKKAKLLFKLKKYGEIFKFINKLQNISKDIFPDKKEFLSKIKKLYFIKLLNEQKCDKAITVMKEYNVSVSKKYDNKIYNCAMETLNYETASVVCNKYLDSPDDKIFIKWMQRKIEVLYRQNDYKDLVSAVDDLCAVKKKGCYKYQLYKFFALWNLKEYKKALKVTMKLDKKKDIRNTDAYINIVRWAIENKDFLLAATYAKKIIDLQDFFKTYPYSPFVDFVYAKYSKNKNEAVKVLKSLLKRVKGENKARALFMLANLTKNQKYLNECIKVKNSTLWKGLCKQAKGLF